jgi:hypothetical protein
VVHVLRMRWDGGRPATCPLPTRGFVLTAQARARVAGVGSLSGIGRMSTSLSLHTFKMLDIAAAGTVSAVVPPRALVAS